LLYKKLMSESTQGILWEVFIQNSAGIPHKHAGSLHAPDAKMALLSARDVYTRRNEGINIWVVPSNMITASSPQESAEFFEPSNDKPYRHPTFYKVPEGVKYL
jgi:ring-1,2-phenylacetyl-CoA epoxidase subunit PaaB